MKRNGARESGSTAWELPASESGKREGKKNSRRVHGNGDRVLRRRKDVRRSIPRGARRPVCGFKSAHHEKKNTVNRAKAQDKKHDTLEGFCVESRAEGEEKN